MSHAICVLQDESHTTTGAAPQFSEWGCTNITASEKSRKILRVVPPRHSGGTTAAKRHESLSDSITQEYDCYLLLVMHL